MGEFSNKVFDVVKRIPRGKVATYGQVACMLGCPRSARYVGFALRANPASANPEQGAIVGEADTGEIPCHRVVFKDGRLCQGYAFGGPNVQKHLLEQEGVVFSDNDHVNLEACLWNGQDYTAL